MKKIIGILLFLMGIGTAYAAPALPSPSQQQVGVFNQALNQLIGSINGWSGSFLNYGLDLFYLLIAIEIIWVGVGSILQGRQTEEMIPIFAKKIILIGFFLYLLMHSNYVLTWVINSFAQIGLNVSGLSPKYLSPSAIIQDGFVSFQQIMSGGLHVVHGNSGGVLNSVPIVSNVAHAGETIVASSINTLIAFIIGIILFFAIFVIAMEYFMIEVEAVLVMIASPIFLALGGTRWTAQYASAYLQYAISVGVRLMVIELYIGLVLNNMIPYIERLLNSVKSSSGMMTSIEAMTLGIILAVLARALPKIANTMITGTSSASGEGIVSSLGKTAALTGGAIAAGTLATAALTGRVGNTVANSVSSMKSGSITGGNGGPNGGNGGPNGGGITVKPPSSPSSSGGGSAVAPKSSTGSSTTVGGGSTTTPKSSTVSGSTTDSSITAPNVESSPSSSGGGSKSSSTGSSTTGGGSSKSSTATSSTTGSGGLSTKDIVNNTINTNRAIKSGHNAIDVSSESAVNPNVQAPSIDIKHGE